ncbi:hypothetical protein [Fibrobacter sp. UWB11]|uniref:hypothetical protein n=1 Tax=Fibrobacter sp. UWB11 TaxID=1896202 RepID=UPI00092B8AFC|nr:hypothetical protein [Fibrobacter sp. UWB11]SIO03565.1 hypothetical protein SAMN05720758_1114 [Fibrobacter sp. UWB11]
MKLQRQIAKNRVVLALPVALLMAANAWSAKQDTDYIDENGSSKIASNCLLLDQKYLNDHQNQINTQSECIAVNEELTYTGNFHLTASNVIFIIEDEAKFTINFNSQSDDNHPIGVGSKTRSGNIKFFGQKNQTGSLILNNTGTQYGRGLSAYGDIQIYGGHITVTSSGKDAIWAQNNIEIYGGYVSTTCTSTSTKPVYVGIKSETRNINIKWANSFYANSDSTTHGALNIAEGLILKDESNGTYSNSTADINNAIKGKTLTPDYFVQIVTNGDNTKRAIINGNYSGTTTNIPQGTEVVSIDYNRTFTAGVPSTVVLPFSLPSGSSVNAKFYYLQEVVQKSDACAWKATLKNIGAGNLPQANTPYAVLTEEGKLQFNLNGGKATFQAPNDLTTSVSEGKWSFIGVYSYKVWEPGDTELGLAYAFAGSNEAQIAKGKFGKIAIAADAATTGYPSANPFRAYLRKKDNTVKLQCPQPQAVLGQNSAQYSISNIPETIDAEFVDETENGEKTTFMARMNTRTGEFTMLPNYDIKGRKVNASSKVRGAYYGKKVIKQ